MPGAKNLKVILVQVAWAASRTKDTYLASKYRRMASRLGKKKALIALAHTILVSIYHMIKKKEPYKDLGADYLDNLYKNRTLRNLKRRLKDLGYEVTPIDMPTDPDKTLPDGFATRSAKEQVSRGAAKCAIS